MSAFLPLSTPSPLAGGLTPLLGCSIRIRVSKQVFSYMKSPCRPPAEAVPFQRFGEDVPCDQLIDRLGNTGARQAGLADDIGQRQRNMADMHVIENAHHSDLLQAGLGRLVAVRIVHYQTQHHGRKCKALPLGGKGTWH